MGEENTVLEATGLRKVFRDFWGRPRTVAVDGVSLRAAPGEVVGLLMEQAVVVVHQGGN